MAASEPPDEGFDVTPMAFPDMPAASDGPQFNQLPRAQYAPAPEASRGIHCGAVAISALLVILAIAVYFAFFAR